MTRDGTKKAFWDENIESQRDQTIAEYMEVLDALGDTDSETSKRAKQIRNELKRKYLL